MSTQRKKEALYRFAWNLFSENDRSKDAQEDHGIRIQQKFGLLVSNVSRTDVLVGRLFEREKLSSKERDDVQRLNSTPIRANEELLALIMKKPKDVYDQFLRFLLETGQQHVHRMLFSDDELTISDTEHSALIRRHYAALREKIDSEILPHLFAAGILTSGEKEELEAEKSHCRRNERLLSIVSRRSKEDFDRFLDALRAIGQNHLVALLLGNHSQGGEEILVKLASMDPPKRLVAVQKVPPQVPPKKGDRPRCPETPANNQPKTVEQSLSTTPAAARRVSHCVDKVERTRSLCKMRESFTSLSPQLQTDLSLSSLCKASTSSTAPNDLLTTCIRTVVKEFGHLKKDIQQKVTVDEKERNALQNKTCTECDQKELKCRKLNEELKTAGSELKLKTERLVTVEAKLEELKKDAMSRFDELRKRNEAIRRLEEETFDAAKRKKKKVPTATLR